MASGKVAIAADDFVGQTYAKASASLENLGLVVKRDDVTRNGDAGEVVSLDKSGRLPDGATVTLSVAVGPVAATPPSSGTSNGGESATKGKSNGKAKGKSKGKGNK
ncbi:PASTA domain-containing protein [Aeromicrobium sp. UC242_57]|uniref:PASTA domain-containing protein n=1 Tax=Aeromicrobium sp. UC242_57 TaxID=3374624 RepID=UPI0037A889B8